MNKPIIELENISKSFDGHLVLDELFLTVHENEFITLLGPSGCGKTTTLRIIGGFETPDTGRVLFDGADITHETPDQRAKRGIFLSFQNPLEIPGITLSDFLRSALEQVTGQRQKLWDFKKQLRSAMDVLHMDAAYADRDLNVGFSGGEKKKAEILQLLMLRPRLAILDETDSGLDVDAVKTVSEGIAAYRRDCGGALLIITHNTKILDALTVDRTHVIAEGSIAAEGGAELTAEITAHGFERFTEK